MVSVVAFGKRSGERCNSFPMPWVRNVQETTGEVQDHPLAGGRHKTAADLQSFVEIADFDSQRLREAVQPAGGHTVDALLVLVRLLVGDADQLGHLLLGQAEHDPTLAHPGPDVAVDMLCPGST
jgi:hypothetical protein